MMNQKKRLRLWLYVVLPLVPLTAVMLFGQGYPAQAMLALVNSGGGWNPWTAVLAGGQAPGYALSSVKLYCQSGTTIAPCNPSTGTGTVTSVTAGDSSITIAGTGAAPTVKINAANANVFSATQKAPTWAMSNSGAITDDFGDIYFTTGSGGATRQSGTNWQLTSAGVYQFTAGNLFAAVDTGISRLGADSIAFGNGTAADKSATINYKQSNVTPGTITAGATPAITTASLQTITLNTNATPTITIATGEHLTLQICQNGTGGFTWAWPASVHGGISSATIAAMAVSTCAVQSFDSFNGTTLVAENTGVTNVAP